MEWIILGMALALVALVVVLILSRRDDARKRQIMGQAMLEQREALQAQLAEKERVYSAELTAMELRYHAALRKFNHTVSHATRMPISIIMGYAGLLRKGIADEAEQRTYLMKICEQADDINKLLTRSLQYEDMVQTVDEISLELQPVELGAFFDQLVPHFTYAAKQSHIQFHYISSPEPVTVMLDPVLMKKVCYNLLENSLKYMAVTGEIRLSVAGLGEGKCLIIWKDNGVGVDKDDLPKLFDMEFRGAGTEGINGSGMGLTMVKNIVEQQGGTITAKSEKGAGITFFVRFE